MLQISAATIFSELKKRDVVYRTNITSECAENLAAHGVQFDSREIKSGNIFLAFRGASQDGHAFIDEALSAGASLIVCSDDRFLSTHSNVIVVSDPAEVLYVVARWWRSQCCNTKFVSVTGSIGKTTVTSLIGHILNKITYGRSYASKKSFNNRLGVSYSICQVSKDCEVAVLEVGMNHVGEISELSKLIRPHFAIVTCIAPVHIGRLGSLEAIARAKLEIIDGMERGGVLLYNGDDPLLEQAVRQRGWRGQCLKFGQSLRGSFFYTDLKLCGLEGVKFTLHLDATKIDITSSLLSSHAAHNITAAIATVLLVNPKADLSEIVLALTSYLPPSGRLNIINLPSGGVILDDCYNANSRSVIAAVRLIQQSVATPKIIILGEMLEMGNFSEALHHEVAAAIAESPPDLFIGVGGHAKIITDSLASKCKSHFYPDVEQAIAAFPRGKPFGIVLVKGSRGVQLDRLVAALREWYQ